MAGFDPNLHPRDHGQFATSDHAASTTKAAQKAGTATSHGRAAAAHAVAASDAATSGDRARAAMHAEAAQHHAAAAGAAAAKTGSADDRDRADSAQRHAKNAAIDVGVPATAQQPTAAPAKPAATSGVDSVKPRRMQGGDAAGQKLQTLMNAPQKMSDKAVREKMGMTQGQAIKAAADLRSKMGIAPGADIRGSGSGVDSVKPKRKATATATANRVAAAKAPTPAQQQSFTTTTHGPEGTSTKTQSRKEYMAGLARTAANVTKEGLQSTDAFSHNSAVIGHRVMAGDYAAVGERRLAHDHATQAGTHATEVSKFADKSGDRHDQRLAQSAHQRAAEAYGIAGDMDSKTFHDRRAAEHAQKYQAPSGGSQAGGSGGGHSDEHLAEVIHKTIDQIPEHEKFGDRSFISDVHSHMSPADRAKFGTDQQFKKKLVQLNRDGHIGIVRADSQGDMDAGKLDKSEIKDMGSSFHFIEPKSRQRRNLRN